MSNHLSSAMVISVYERREKKKQREPEESVVQTVVNNTNMAREAGAISVNGQGK